MLLKTNASPQPLSFGEGLKRAYLKSSPLESLPAAGRDLGEVNLFTLN
jgi:hypothetical protein